MDKRNYDVDNILDEIKQRKARQNSGIQQEMTPRRTAGPTEPTKTIAPPAAVPKTTAPSVPPADATTAFEPVAPSAQRQAPTFVPRGASVREAGDGTTVVSMPVEKHGRSPLDFGGHVQPITDRARNRPTRFTSGQAQQTAPPVAPITVTDTPPVPIKSPYAELRTPPVAQRTTPSEIRTPPAASRTTPAEPRTPPAVPRTPPAPPITPSAAPPESQGDFTFVTPGNAFQTDTPVEPERKVIDFSLYRPKMDDEPDYFTADVQNDSDGIRGTPNFPHLAGGQTEYEESDGDYYDDEQDQSEVDMSEYNRVDDRTAVSRDIAATKLWLWIRTVLTLGLTVSLIYLTFSGKYSLSLPPIIFPEENLQLFIATFALMGTLIALVCSSTVGGGIISLFKLRASSDTMAALALLAAIGQSVAAALNPAAVNVADMTLYVSAAAMAMLFNCFGKLAMVGRIQANFRVIAGSAQKRAIVPAKGDRFVNAFLPPDGGPRPTVAHSVEAGFFTGFLGLSYSDKYDVSLSRGVAPICLTGALLVGGLTYMLTQSLATAYSALTAILCVAATLSSTFIESIPLAKLARKITPKGGVVSGSKAVESFCDTKAVVLGDKDLFPPGLLQIHGIKADRIDEAILYAASVICATESALGPAFLEMIGGKEELLKRAENIVFEDEKGISAWVDSRRILIGNRELMQFHGVELPPEAYNPQGSQPGNELLYLSISGEATAQFVVSYQIDEELALELDYLQTKNIKLIVHTVDPGMSAQRLWLLYGYPKELIEIMPASLHQTYGRMTAPRETETAEAVYTGKACVMLRMLRACIGIRKSILIATVIQLVQVVLGYGMITFIAFMGAMSGLSIIHIGIYQLFWFFGILLVQQLRSD